MNIAIIIIFSFLLLSLYLGIRARKGKDMDLEQWTVGGRGFGPFIIMILLAGEIYSTSTFLGSSGWAYGIAVRHCTERRSQHWATCFLTGFILLFGAMEINISSFHKQIFMLKSTKVHYWGYSFQSLVFWPWYHFWCCN